ncbi:lipopolysaccharide biosynthesis protein [Flavobacterium sp. DSR3-2]|uniref:lipopolysaccharide biosynthesis protein n=1 Tax=Flavobacterium sp. DSR3-2 TaxID=2804634 RepID=UPI003CEB38A0
MSKIQLKKLKLWINSGHLRTVQLKKQMLSMFILNGFQIALNLALVPLLLRYLGDVKYGIWITLSSVITWVTFFDIGLGNGLRNKFAESVALKDYKKARIYVSTTYALMTIIMFVVFIIFLIVYNFVDWGIIFNVPKNEIKDFSKLVFWIFTFFLIQFVVKLVGALYSASQKTSRNSVINLVSGIISFIVVFILYKSAYNSLLFFGIAYSIIPIIVYIIFSLKSFNDEYIDFSPSWSHVRWKYSKDLFGLGFKYFIIQISIIIIAQTDLMIITQVLGPENVTPFSITQKYFSISYMVFGIAMAPLWSAYTEAHILNDYNWMRRIIKKQLKIIPYIIFGLILMALLFKPILKIWIGKSFDVIGNEFILLFVIQAFFVVWNNIFGMVLNGLSKVRLNTILVLISAIINIPLSILFAKHYAMGINGVVLGTLVSGVLVFIINPIQVYYFIFSNKKSPLLTKIFS